MPLKTPPIKPLTLKFNKIVPEIICNIGISLPGGIEKLKEAVSLKALWDTGATNCVITQATAKKMNLKPIGIVPVHHGGGTTFENEYLVNIYLPNKVLFPNTRITECSDTSGKFDFIIGMNIISKGDFSITNFNGKTTMSYRWPSIEEIDFVRNAKLKRPSPLPLKKNPNRNDPCPCGSGKKYKYCCGRKKT